MSSLSATISQGCASGGGVLTLSAINVAPGAGPDLLYSWTVVDAASTDYGGPIDITQLPITLPLLPNGPYLVRVRADEQDGSSSYTSSVASFTIACAAAPGGLTLDSLGHTDETVAGNDGTATIQASGGTGPLTASLPGKPNQAATAGSPVTFTGLSATTHTVRVTDSTGAFVEGTVTIAAFVAPVAGCIDEYAGNYNPAATAAASCTYGVSWRSAWGPARVAVVVESTAEQLTAYMTANLRVGFRPGHQLATNRPLGASIALHATVAPDGYATFRLAPFLRGALGSSDGTGGRRLDLNSPTAHTDDLLVGYELRRPDGELLDHGYALNAAVPDAALGNLTPFATRLPVWPGFDDYPVSSLASDGLGRFGAIEAQPAYQLTTVLLPCPAQPLPVAWLAPQGGFAYWVFSGRPAIGDDVGDGQAYQEAGTGERRWASRGEARKTVSATSGVFKGVDLLNGLRTLWASPQVWYRPDPTGPWVPVTIEPGSFPAGRLGVTRQQLNLSLTEASARYAQGQ